LCQGVSQRLPVVPDVSIETCVRPSKSSRVPLLTPRKLRAVAATTHCDSQF
jgi:hypothetical protein